MGDFLFIPPRPLPRLRPRKGGIFLSLGGARFLCLGGENSLAGEEWIDASVDGLGGAELSVGWGAVATSS